MTITTNIDKFGLGITEYVLRHPVQAVVWCLLLIMVSATGLGKNTMSSDHRDFFGEENPQLIAFDNIEETYGKLDNIVFVIRTDEQRALGKESYQIIQFVTERAWQLPAAFRVDSLSNYQHTRVEQDDLLVEDLLGPSATYSPAQLAEKEAISLAEPLLVGNLIARDAGTTAINVVALYGDGPDNDIRAFVGAARALAAETEKKFPGTRVALTASSMMSLSFSEAGIADSKTLIPGMYLVLFLALMCVYRSTSAVLATFAVVSASTIVPLGISGYAGAQLTSISIIAPIVIMTLAVADSVHILVTMLNLMRQGIDKQAALRESMRINFLAVSVTSLTTIIGFLCLNFSDTPPYHQLGNLSAVGILAAWLFSVVLLPGLITLLPVRVSLSKDGEASFTRNIMRWLAQFTTGNYKVILLVSFGLCASLLSQLPKLELNDQFINFFDKSIPFRNDTDFAQEHLGGAFAVHFELSSGEPDGVSNPEYLRTLDNFTAWLRDQPFVSSVYSFSDITKRLNRNMHGDDPAYYRVPESRDLAAQYLLLYELSLPYGLDLNDRINVDKSATRLSVTLDNPTARQIREFGRHARDWLRANASESMWTEPTGSAWLFAHISQRNIDSMLRGNIVAVIAISLVLVIALQHIGLGLLSMLPNLLPVALALSLWAVIEGVAGMATTIIAASSLGIVVDNTTHFLSKYIRARREKGKDRVAAISYSFETVGVAIIANAVVLMCGFALLAFSAFQPNFQMGVLTALTIALALIVDLICLPALLMLGYQKGPGQTGEN